MQEPSPLVRWLNANKNSDDFGASLERLLSFACAEWIRADCGEVLPPAEALSRVVLADIPEYPVASWLEAPLEKSLEIANFCDNIKKVPLPAPLRRERIRLLDLRGVKCPKNAARARLVMAGFPQNEPLEIYLDDGSPIENVPGALVADGCRIESREKKEDCWSLVVVKPAKKE